MKNVKIKDIAEDLGLSRNTVSKVLNGKHVPERTKKLVLERASQLNYKQMSEESNPKYNLLLISAKPLTNINFFVPILRTIENICFERGHQLFQYVVGDPTNIEVFLRDYIKNLNINGIICIETFSNSFIEMITGFNVPTVFLDGSAELRLLNYNFDVVIQDNYSTIGTLITNLYDKGIRSFGFVGDINHCLSFRERYRAVLMTTTFCHLNHDFNHDFLYPDNSDFYQNSSTMASEIRKKNNLAEAYICANDFIARLFITALASVGIKCPDDVKVIGFDNTYESRSIRPHITTVEVDSSEIGNVLVNSLVNKIKSERTEKVKIVIYSKVIERETTEIKK